ncbi:MATE family efflux transporter [Candidatus Bipolaricaulota bacterium]|nr:MATE family efflux transporter [Candidatus Bipolaricaulota bacterium]
MSAISERFGKCVSTWLPHTSLSKDVLRLATPVTLGMLTFTLLSIVDTAMLGRLGALPLAAAGVAGVLYFAIVFPISSMSVGTQSLVARRFGEGNETQCGPILNTGLMLCLFLGLPLVFATPWLARMIAPLSSNDPQVIEASGIYLWYRLLGSPFMLINSVSSGFFAGIGKTKHQMVSSILITVTNIVLDYALIFGHAGFPQLGIKGASIASSIALAAGSIYYIAVLILPGYRSRYGVFGRPWFTTRWLRPMVRLSSPILAQRVLSNGAWAIFFAIIARIGTVELAATNVIRSIFHLSIMSAVGLGTASAALLGQNLGANRPKRAEQLAWESVKLATYAMIVVGLLFVVAPGFVFRIYTSELSVIAAGRLPLMLLGPVQVFAGFALVLSLSLQGAGNTRFVMGVEFLCVLLYLPTVYFLGLHTSLGLLGAWTGEYIYWAVLSVAMIWKFRTGSWKTIKL